MSEDSTPAAPAPTPIAPDEERARVINREACRRYRARRDADPQARAEHAANQRAWNQAYYAKNHDRLVEEERARRAARRAAGLPEQRSEEALQRRRERDKQRVRPPQVRTRVRRRSPSPLGCARPEESRAARKAYNLRYREQHREKLNQYDRERYAKRRESLRVYNKAYRAARKDYFRQYERARHGVIRRQLTWKRAGIVFTAQEYTRLLDLQRGRCAICGKADGKRALSVDHDHSTGRVRGLLCKRCNTGIGLVRDRSARLHRLVLYLKTIQLSGGITPVFPRKRTSHKRWLTHGLDQQQYESLLIRADGTCMACGARPRGTWRAGLHIDHDHSTGIVRGMVCGPCNRSLGLFRDSIYLLHRAAGYLRGYMTFPSPQQKHPAQTSIWTQIER